MENKNLLNSVPDNHRDNALDARDPTARFAHAFFWLGVFSIPKQSLVVKLVETHNRPAPSIANANR
jgi:hypothetical protein